MHDRTGWSTDITRAFFRTLFNMCGTLLQSCDESLCNQQSNAQLQLFTVADLVAPSDYPRNEGRMPPRGGNTPYLCVELLPKPRIG